MKVFLLGTDNFSAVALKAVIEGGYEAVAAMTHSKNKNFRRFSSATERWKIPFHVVENINGPEAEKIISYYGPDVILSVHFDRILKPNIIKLARLRAINLHPSKLPAYRGTTPFQRVLQAGEMETAVSIHYIEEGVDTGDIIASKNIPLTPDTYLYDLQKIMIENYPQVIIKALDFIRDGRKDAIKQPLKGATYFGNINEREREIDMIGSVEKAYNLIRAMSRPFLGARAGKYTVWKADKTRLPLGFAAEPGSANILGGGNSFSWFSGTEF